eukprot:4813620-Amphidinium_carterae.1
MIKRWHFLSWRWESGSFAVRSRPAVASTTSSTNHWRNQSWRCHSAVQDHFRYHLGSFKLKFLVRCGELVRTLTQPSASCKHVQRATRQYT